MKKVGVLIGVVAAFLAGIYFSSHFLRPETGTASIATGAIEQPVVVQKNLVESSPKIDIDIDSEIDAEEDSASRSVESYESQAIKDDAINLEFVLATDHLEENFSRLAEEFRTSSNPEGNRKREEFQQFFYSQVPLLQGQVFLDLLECGDQLCVVELRGIDPAVLRSFMDEAIAWEAFGSKAIIEAPTQQPNTGRLIFSYDPEINAIAIPSFGG